MVTTASSVSSDTEQHYTPLTVDEYRATADWESDDEMVQVNVSWCSQLELEGDEYIVAIGNDNCTTPDRNPPCFLVRNSVSMIDSKRSDSILL